jgi:SAM-dependent methyltransferase
MHKSSYVEMDNNLKKYYEKMKNEKLTVVDVGSYNVEGKTYKELMPLQWEYVGVDIVSGPNVDVVMPNSKKIPLDDESVDIVISGQCLEHCKTPWILVEEIARILKNDGMCFLVAPAVWKMHRYPVDCFRYYPDGMASLMEESGLTVINTYVNPLNGLAKKPFKNVDCWGIGRKELCTI